MSLIKRVSRVISRRRRARELGFSFRRARSFELPKSIRIFGNDVAINVPPRNGMETCFFEVIMDDTYGLRHLRHENIKTILDIGGNVGFFSLTAREAFPKATIHVYEPNPAVLPYLTAHAAAANSRIFAEAVGAEPGRVTLTDEDYVNMRSRIDAAGNIPQVAFRTALERIGGHCDLVKLDCEGAEWQILTDFEAWQNVDYLTMEYHLSDTSYRHDDIVEALARINFNVRKRMPADEFGVVWASRKREHVTCRLSP
jgi:FkbM family methyltransferase